DAVVRGDRAAVAAGDLGHRGAARVARRGGARIQPRRAGRRAAARDQRRAPAGSRGDMSRGGGRGARAPPAGATPMLVALAAAPAFARSSVVVPYTLSEVWPAAIRFLRVDRNYRVREKDEPAGYVLFDLPENKRTYRGALEMVKTTDDEGRAATQLNCSIADLPRRYEVTLLDLLAAKVAEERGPPPAHRPPVARDPPPREDKPRPAPHPDDSTP